MGNALLCSIACDLLPAGLGAIEHCEQARVGVADGAASAAGGAGGGQYATKPAKGKSRRWRDGGSGRDKAVARSATAWLSTRHGSRLQAGERLFAGRRSGVAAAVQEGTAVAGGTKPGRGFMRAGGVQVGTA